MIFFAVVINTVSLAQKETNNWLFGDSAGLNFNPGVPVPVAGGQTNTVEGVSSISDANGDLLFYTDGRTVWNKNHEELENGNGLLGGSSSTQSVLIVKQPRTDSLYYVFTVMGYGLSLIHI